MLVTQIQATEIDVNMFEWFEMSCGIAKTFFAI